MILFKSFIRLYGKCGSCALENLNEEKTESEVKALISEALAELPNYKKVTKVVIRKEPFPKTTSNKIIRG